MIVIRWSVGLRRASVVGPFFKLYRFDAKDHLPVASLLQRRCACVTEQRGEDVLLLATESTGIGRVAPFPRENARREKT